MNKNKLRFKDADENEYPEWAEETLENLADWINGFAFKPEHLGESGTTVIKIKELLDPNDLSVKTEITTVPLSNHIKNGDIVFSWSMTMAVRKWQSGFAYLNQHLYKVLPKNGVDKDFLLHCLAANIPAISNLMHGGTAKHITRKDLMPYKVEVPCLEEQEKIASLFSKLDERIELREQKIAGLKEYKKGLQQAVFGNNGERTLRFKDKNGNDYPEWVEKSLSEVSEIIMGQSPDSKNYTDDYTKYPFIGGNADLKKGKIMIRMYTTQKTKESFIGDVIMTVRAPVGAIARSDMNSVIGRGVCAIRSDYKEFIYHYLSYFYSLGGWEKMSQGSTFDSVNSVQIKDFTIDFPCLEEQEKIANLFSKIDNQIELEEQLLQASKDEKQGLMQRVF